MDVAIDAVGHPAVYEQAFDARDLAGTVVLVGVPNPTMTIELPLIEVFGRGGALKSSWYGDCLPSRDFPMLIDLYLQGRFDLDAFVSETIGLDDVEAAFEKMHHGDVLRVGRGLLKWRPRIDKAVVSGVFSLDGQDFDVDNNVWLVGDDDEVLVIDAPHDAAPIVEAIGGRRVTAIVLTHGHNDHITAAVALREATGAPIWFNPPTGCSGTSSTRTRHPTTSSPRARRSTSPGRRSSRCSTPGHSPGSTCLHARGPRHGVHRRHAVLRRARRDRPLVQRPPDDRRVDPRAAADAAGRHRRPHRARRRHDDRGGDRRTSPDGALPVASSPSGRGLVRSSRWRIAATFRARSSSASTARVASANVRFSRCRSALGPRDSRAERVASAQGSSSPRASPNSSRSIRWA